MPISASLRGLLAISSYSAPFLDLSEHARSSSNQHRSAQKVGGSPEVRQFIRARLSIGLGYATAFDRSEESLTRSEAIATRQRNRLHAVTGPFVRLDRIPHLTSFQLKV